ncbi:unnamed protein product [Anisakis simplex]|uniref:Uncharacterized protein n=1 Tax=Anisakis simplex TaxID=6269 RepID=A0A0M3JCQ6_ANISI|nr:unnamed protein product [Anisakis simplex]
MAKKKATVRFADDEDVRQNQRSTQRNRKLSVSAPQRAFSASELSEDERMILQSRRSSTRIPGTPSLIARTPQPLLPESERFSSNLRQRPSIDRFQVAVISRTPPPSTSLNSRRRQRAQSKSDETTPNYDRSQQKPPDLTNDSNLQTIMKSGSLEPEPLLNPMNSTNSKTRNNGPKTLANDPSLRANDEMSDNKISSVHATRSSLSPLSPLPATYKSKQQQDFDTESAVVELTKQQPNNQSQVDYEVLFLSMRIEF